MSTALSTPSGVSKVTWTVVPASQFPGGAQEVGAAVLEEHTWAAVTSAYSLFVIHGLELTTGL